MEIKPGLSLVETKEYFGLLKFKETIEKNALVIITHGNTYNNYQYSYQSYYTTNESIDSLTKELSSKTEENNKLKYLEHKIISLVSENDRMNDKLLKLQADNLITKTKSVSFLQKLFKF